MDNRLFIIAITALATAAMLPLVSALCRYIALVDRPENHKRDVQPIPLSGGLIILLVASLSLFVIGQAADFYWYLCALWCLAAIGILDDRFHLPALPRLVLQALVVLLFIIHLGETRINSIGPLFADTGPINFFGTTSYIFSTICILALINAFNMLDGIDGLAGTLFCVMAFGFLLIAPPDAAASSWPLYAVFVGCTAGFLLHNLHSPITPAARSYLGDSGSLMLSALLGILAIRSTQPAVAAGHTFTPIIAVWILALPIMELASATVRRLIQRQNVMTADRGHIHHRLMDMGLSETQSVFVIATLAIAMIAMGMYLESVGIVGLLSFAICMGFYLLYIIAMSWPVGKKHDEAQSDAACISGK